MRLALVVGIPGTGKTTFLAALWHVVNADDVESDLALKRLGKGDRKHLNDIANLWRQAYQQVRTQYTGSRLVSMELETRTGLDVDLTFPDYAGEVFQQLWETRECPQDLADVLKEGDVVLFIHSDKDAIPHWIVDRLRHAEQANVPLTEDATLVQRWKPEFAPAQTVLVDILQMLRLPPLDCGPRRLAVVYSAWDLAKDMRLSPMDYFGQHAPLLAQYLTANADHWTWKVYGLSAQGGPYDSTEEGARTTADAEELRNRPAASERVELVDAGHISHDLTRPIAWLIDDQQSL